MQETMSLRKREGTIRNCLEVIVPGAVHYSVCNHPGRHHLEPPCIPCARQRYSTVAAIKRRGGR